MASVGIRDVKKAYGTTEVIHGVDIAIADGEFLVLVGPSGCGKSTLLRMIAGLEDDHRRRDPHRRPRRQRRAAEGPRHRDGVSELRALSAHDASREHGVLAASCAARRKAEIDAAGRPGRRHPRPEPLLDRYPRQLSGGQRQRVAMGRAIVRDPEVFLFDEPLSNLDAKLRVADARRDQGAAPAAADHHRLRHARPDRGDDHGRPHRRDARRRRRADRHAARALRPARPISSSPASSARRR